MAARQVVLEPTLNPAPCVGCGRTTNWRCVCCGAKFCRSCEPSSEDHGVDPGDYYEEERR